MTALDISPLVAEEVASIRDRAQEQDVCLVASLEPAPLPVVDPRLLRRAVRELLDNTLAHAPAGSTVRVEVTTSGSEVRIEVADRGDGIDLDDAGRLVRPFERGTRPGQHPAGRGLGLALAWAAAVRHGGRLGLSEASGGGLQVSVELPADGRR